MKNKWETARYLIDAKKCIDSLWYIAENVDQLKYINLKTKTNNLLIEFYIKCCVVIDEYLTETGNKKKDLCSSDNVIARVYYERDKNGAHKDENYMKREYASLEDIVNDVKAELSHIRLVCADCIPDVVTLDFVPYDRELFRLIYHVTADVEESIMKKKYPLKDTIFKGETVFSFNVFDDTEDYRNIKEEDRSNYGVVINNGICFYEGLQERQDSMIKINLLYGENKWCSVNKAAMDEVIELKKLGAFDEFGIIQDPPSDPLILEKIMKILCKQ